MGIEPTAQAWEAWVLPLYDARYSSIVIMSPGDLQTALRRRHRWWGMGSPFAPEQRALEFDVEPLFGRHGERVLSF